jgi:hypothetical protein
MWPAFIFKWDVVKRMWYLRTSRFFTSFRMTRKRYAPCCAERNNCLCGGKHIAFALADSSLSFRMAQTQRVLLSDSETTACAREALPSHEPILHYYRTKGNETTAWALENILPSH